MKTDRRTEGLLSRGDLVSNPSAASPSLSFFHLPLIILQRNKLNLSAGNLIEVSSWKSFYTRTQLTGEDRPLIITLCQETLFVHSSL